MTTRCDLGILKAVWLAVHLTASLNITTMAENKGAHWQPCLHITVHFLIHAQWPNCSCTHGNRTPHTCYLLPLPIMYYKCVWIVQIAETIIEFWELKMRTINKSDNRFLDYWFTSLPSLPKEKMIRFIIDWNCSSACVLCYVIVLNRWCRRWETAEREQCMRPTFPMIFDDHSLTSIHRVSVFIVLHYCASLHCLSYCYFFQINITGLSNW